MNGILVSRFVQNIIWLTLAIACTGIFQQFVFTGVQPLSTKETALLGAVMLSSSLLIELLTRETRERSLFRSSLLLLLAISIVLSFFSQILGLFVPHGAIVLATALLFVLFRWISLIWSGEVEFPSFLSTTVLLLGNGSSAQKIHEIINSSHGRFILGGTMPFTDDMNNESGMPSDKLYQMAKKAGARMIVVSFPERRGIMPVQQILRCRMLGLNVVEAQTFYERVTRKLYVENLKPSNIIFSSGFRISRIRTAIKRFGDVVGSCMGLLLLLPVFPVIALVVRLDSPGPVFFRQIRTGLGGTPFRIIKFRTMTADAEKDTGAVWASHKDPRITRVGSFLRKTRLDEVPQLINVLLGDMSLVGPRPERPEFISELEKSIPFYSERHYVKPGVTGWAQVRYRYGSSVEDALEKLRYDLYYIKNQSFRLELEILLRTVLVIFSGSGAR